MVEEFGARPADRKRGARCERPPRAWRPGWM